MGTAFEEGLRGADARSVTQSTCALEQHLNRLVDQASSMAPFFPVECANRYRASPTDRCPTGPRKRPLSLKKNTLSYCRPLDGSIPRKADLAYGSLELAALEYRARRGEIILLYEDETIVCRFALPRLGWWRRAQRYRLPTRPLSQGQTNSKKVTNGRRESSTARGAAH